MIKREEVVKIGKLNKPHGIHGEISFTFSKDVFDRVENPFLICELDGIFVPFRLLEYRFTSDNSALVRLNTIDSDEKARRFANHDVFFAKKQLPEENPEEDFTWDYFIGFELEDQRYGLLGTISAIDDSTLNTLFILQKDKDELLIPASEGIITKIDDVNKRIFVDLPEGFLEI